MYPDAASPLVRAPDVQAAPLTDVAATAPRMRTRSGSSRSTTTTSVTPSTSVGTGGYTVKGELEVPLRLVRCCIRMRPYYWRVRLMYRLLRSRMWLQPHQGCVSILLLTSRKMDKRLIGSLLSSSVPGLTEFKGKQLTVSGRTST